MRLCGIVVEIDAATGLATACERFELAASDAEGRDNGDRDHGREQPARAL
mgnify:CR=1 FL=1